MSFLMEIATYRNLAILLMILWSNLQNFSQFFVPLDASSCLIFFGLNSLAESDLVKPWMGFGQEITFQHWSPLENPELLATDQSLRYTIQHSPFPPHTIVHIEIEHNSISTQINPFSPPWVRENKDCQKPLEFPEMSIF